MKYVNYYIREDKLYHPSVKMEITLDRVNYYIRGDKLHLLYENKIRYS